MPETLVQNIKTFINERLEAKNDKNSKDHEKKKAKASTAFEPESWIDDATRRAGQISMATHVLKFTHSSAKGSNILDHDLGYDPRYLDTEVIKDKKIDVVGNAGAGDVARFLQLTDENNTSLLSYLEKDDYRPLELLADGDGDKVKQWATGLKQVLRRDTSPESHRLGKQIYFPLGDGTYHLLAPLYSSSLAQVLFNEVQHSRFSKEMKEIREAKKNNHFHQDPLIEYRNLAVTVAGGSKPQNVSLLNGKRERGGKTYLFSSAAPNWQAQTKPPLGLDSILRHRDVDYHTKKPIKRLTQFLVKLNTESAKSNMSIRKYVDDTVDEVIEQILWVVAQWQQLPAGWSNESRLRLEQRCWLDPDNCQRDRFDDDWQHVISTHIGLWLKDKVNEGSKNQFTLGQTEVTKWQKQCLDALKEIA